MTFTYNIHIHTYIKRIQTLILEECYLSKINLDYVKFLRLIIFDYERR